MVRFPIANEQRTAQPSSVTTQVGSSATFSVTATVTGTPAPLTYQWQRNAVAIEGATNATFAIPTITIDDISTCQLRVRVSAGPAFKLSDSASLIVPMPPAMPTTYYATQVIADKPLFYWNFDESIGNAAQIAPITRIPPGSENDLAPTGTAGMRTTHAEIGSGLNLGSAVFLDGYSFVRADAPRLVRSLVTNAYVLELWLQAYGGVNEYLGNFGPPGGDSTPALIHNFTAPGYLDLFGAGGRTGTKGPALADNAWHHVAWVNHNNASAGTSNRVDVYFDGVLTPDVGNGFNRNLDVRAFMFGAALPSGVDGFYGYLDEIAAYDLALLEGHGFGLAGEYHRRQSGRVNGRCQWRDQPGHRRDV